MPKAQFIDPDVIRRKGQVTFDPIPINHYDRTVTDELAELSPEDLVRIQHDMQIIRAFENMLNEIKLRGVWNGIEYQHRGPAHLSIGQEGAAVGQAFLLDADDHIYGSHRSHGEILAKGLSAIEKLDDNSLMTIMSEYWSGSILKVIESNGHPDAHSLAIDFLIYGALAEIFARETGFNKGMGGSMHAFFPPLGIYPNNAIVGGSADIAVGAALFKHVRRRKGIVIANIGDASASCGPVWEAICFATMDQYRKLWDGSRRGGLPLIFSFQNNFYGMGGQPVGETMGFEVLARLGAGVNPQQMHAERVDGCNPLAVIDAIRRKKQILADGDGPVLLDTVVYRYSGHSPSDASAYRTREEVDAWREHDPILLHGRALLDAGVCSQGELDEIEQKETDRVRNALLKAIDDKLSPHADLKRSRCLLDQATFSNQAIDALEAGEPEVLMPLAENPRVQALAKRSRWGYDEAGEPLPKTRCIGIRDALFEAIAEMFYTDPTLIAYGEENRDWGGAFAVYRGLTEALPYHRLFNSPIAEGAIVGTAVGYALEGGRALVELMYTDFLGRAGDEVFNQLAKWQAMSGGLLRMPVVLRISVGSKYGAQHSQDWSALAAHIPGLKLCFPATPYDAKGLMYAALRGTDPVVFFESQRIYGQPELFVEGGVPAGRYEVAFGEPAVRREGTDLTILTVGATLYRAIEAADQLQASHGLSVEVIDARSIVPFNYEPVIESIRKTRKILLASDACERGSVLQTMAAKITQLAFDELDAPPVVVGARNWITPPDELEDAFFPFACDIIDAVHEHILPLKGYTPLRDCSNADFLRRYREGV